MSKKIMHIFKKIKKPDNPHSLAYEIRSVIKIRILWCFIVLFFAFFTINILNLFSSYHQLQKNVNEQCAILNEFTISQLLINNDSVVELNLDTINANNPQIHFSWIKQKKLSAQDNISWKLPFIWTSYCPIHSEDGENFGYFKATGSLMYDTQTMHGVTKRTLAAGVFLLIIFLLLYPLANKIPQRLFIMPIMELLNLLRNGQVASRDKDDETNNVMLVEMQEIKLKLIQLLKEAESHSHAVAFSQIASKVAHDIRSPLAALNMLLKKNADALPEAERQVIQRATQRINDIADNLLYERKSNQVSNPILLDAMHPIKPECMAMLLKNIVLEKKAQYVESLIQFQLVIDDNVKMALVNVNANELNRALSNLMNNAIEAMLDKPSEAATQLTMLTIKLSYEKNNYVLCSLTDTGMGMRSEQLSDVLIKGISMGKKNGTGIGLSSAVASIESWGGTFLITSEWGKGTCVSLMLPIFNARPDFIFIDDSVYLTDAWKAQATLNHQHIVILNTITQVNRCIDYFDKDTLLYVDSHLGEDIKGEDFAKTLYEKGFKSIHLCTGMDASEFSEMPWIKKIVGKEYPM